MTNIEKVWQALKKSNKHWQKNTMKLSHTLRNRDKYDDDVTSFEKV